MGARCARGSAVLTTRRQSEPSWCPPAWERCQPAGWPSRSSVISLPGVGSCVAQPPCAGLPCVCSETVTFTVSLGLGASRLGDRLNKLPPSAGLLMLQKLKGVTLRTRALVFGLLQQHLL